MKIWTTYTNVPTQKIPNRYYIFFLAQMKDDKICHRKMKKGEGQNEIKIARIDFFGFEFNSLSGSKLREKMI